MRRWSLRSLLFVLALVIQTATGGTAFTGTLAGVSADCALDGSDVHRTSPRHGGHHQQHDCVLCQVCAGGSPAALAVTASDYRVAFADGARLGLDLALLAAPPALSEQAHQPRAPPLA